MSAAGASPSAAGTADTAGRVHNVIVYSDDAEVRAQVRTAIGRRPADDLGRIEWIECANGGDVLTRVEQGGVDLCIFDGEAWPTGGMGLCKQMKDEFDDCPPVLLLVARRDDGWLATWSAADAVVWHPLDPPTVTDAAADLLRNREAALPVRRSAY